MKHHWKILRPPATPRRSVVITLTIGIAILAALTTITNTIASSSIPETIQPYVPYAWLSLAIILFLTVFLTFWNAWYTSGQPAPRSTSTTPISQPAPQSPGTSSAPIPTPSSAPAPVPGSAHYHTCVLSYSDKDATFVNKLYNDLKAHGVPCLLVEQDLKIGDKLRAEIYRAIHQLDKLLLVLSHNTIENTWVENAIDTALERESQQPGTYLLFPLRLDDAVLTTDLYWASAVRQRLIGNFSLWQDDAAYQQALQRVLRDLRV